MVFGEKYRAVILQLFLDQLLHPQLLFYPERDSFYKGTYAERHISKVGLKDPFKFDERLVVKSDVTYLVNRYAGFFQALFDGIPGERVIMFPARETLLLYRGYYIAVLYEGRSRIMVET